MAGYPGRLLDSSSGAELAGQARADFPVPTKASDAILGLGAETTDPGQEGHVQASMPGSRRSQARKGTSRRLCKCTHGTELIAISQDGGRCRRGWAAAQWLEE